MVVLQGQPYEVDEENLDLPNLPGCGFFDAGCAHRVVLQGR